MPIAPPTPVLSAHLDRLSEDDYLTDGRRLFRVVRTPSPARDTLLVELEDCWSLRTWVWSLPQARREGLTLVKRR